MERNALFQASAAVTIEYGTYVLFETSVTDYRSKRRNIPEDRRIQTEIKFVYTVLCAQQ